MPHTSLTLHSIIINWTIGGAIFVWILSAVVAFFVYKLTVDRELIPYGEWTFSRYLHRLASTLFYTGLLALIALLVKALFFTEVIKW